MKSFIFTLLAAVFFSILASGCASEHGASDVPRDAGLVALNMDSRVGVLLDELPPGEVRELAAANAMLQPTTFWEDRAKRQARLMAYRLVFRSLYYDSGVSNRDDVHGALPLPPPSTWIVSIVGSPYRTQIEDHDLVVVDYHFSATILTDAESPGRSEGSLGTIGGTWTETFTLPADPELLFERTGYACMNEDSFPPNSVFEYNVNYFYDDACDASPGTTCHVSADVTNSCTVELRQMVGSVAGDLVFSRLPWDDDLADDVRVGTVTPAGVSSPAPDLAVVTDGLSDEYAFRWQFFTRDDCELEEEVISELGWRRVLMFSAILQNNGLGELEVGDPSDAANPFVEANDFEFSACHEHYHFSHYGKFNYADLPGAKRAFCLVDTNRYHNDETTALDSMHVTCDDQGISPGWGDEYNWGIPGQWIDVTGYTNENPQTLSFSGNPDQFLCEGTHALDGDGGYTYESTSFINPENGLPEERIGCDFLPDWDANNVGSTVIAPGKGSFVTALCRHGEIGPNRNCDFAEHPSFLHDCISGESVTLSCSATSSVLQVLRVCEESGQRGTGVACTLASASVNVVIGSQPTEVTFVCPAVRDAAMEVSSDGILEPHTVEGVGGYSVYQASIGTLSGTDSGSQPPIACTGW